MTEAEWTICTELERLISYLKEANSKHLDRKARLFACACARQVWGKMHTQGQKAVEVAERFADGFATPEELASIRNGGMEAWSRASMAWPVMLFNGLAVSLENGFSAALYAAKHTPQVQIPAGSLNRKKAKAEIRRAIHALFKDIFGNPFRRITVDPSWLTWHDGLIASMARQMYDSRDFIDLPILADALEEAGCTDQDILGHCRSEGEHVRGCWVIDALLGKS